MKKKIIYGQKKQFSRLNRLGYIIYNNIYNVSRVTKNSFLSFKKIFIVAWRGAVVGFSFEVKHQPVTLVPR